MTQHIFFLGDASECTKWLGWAKNQLRKLKRYHPLFDGESHGVQRYQLDAAGADFLQVMVKMVNDQEYIIIWAGDVGLYMESGVLDHRNIAPLNEDTYLPSILNYGDEIVAIRGDGAALGELEIAEIEPNKLSGENRGEGDSKSVGCSKSSKQNKITVSSGFGSATFGSEEGKAIYCPDLYTRKNVQARMPASRFSGKLRSYVQALYGSKRDDYALDTTLIGLGPLKIENANLAWTYNRNSALFSGRNYEYFLLQAMNSGLWARPMVPSEAGEKLRTYLNNNSDLPEARQIEYETYLLSTLRVDGDSEWVKISEDAGEAYSKGTPLYWGWSWNMEGTQAYAVTIQGKPGTTDQWQTTMFRISVAERDLAETLDEGRLAAVFVTEEDTQDVTFRVAGDHMWYPDDISGGMRILVTQTQATGGPTQIESDVPIYVMYNYEDDRFDVVRYKREDLGTGQGALGGSHTNANDRAIPCCNLSACGYYSDVGGTAVDIGFYAKPIQGGDDIWSATGFSANQVEFSGNEATISSPSVAYSGNPVADEAATCGFGSGTAVWLRLLGDCGHSFDTCSPPDIAILDYIDGYQGGSFGTEIHVDGDFTYESMLVVCREDCDSVYLAFRDKFDGTVNLAGHTLQNSVVVSGVRLWERGIFGGDEMTNGITQVCVGWDVDEAGGLPKVKLHAQNTGKWTSVTSEDTEWYHTDVRRIGNGEEEQVYEERIVTNEALAGVLILPSCMDNTAAQATSDVEDAPQWTHAAQPDSKGWEFDPVLFPEAETMDPVISHTSYNHGDYRSTELPDEDTWIEKGGYGFEDNHITNFFNFVGFA